MTDEVLKSLIMNRVNRIHSLRKWINAITLKCTAMFVFIAGMLSLVSISNVVANMPQTSDAIAMFYFSKYAFLNTELLVQMFLVASLFFGVWMVRDIVRMTSFTHRKIVAH
jgi:hypothetical protein